MTALQLRAVAPQAWVSQIQDVLTPDLRKAEWRAQKHPLAGHCYHASEALWHLLGGPTSGYVPVVSTVTSTERHWFLRHRETGQVIDLTGEQYSRKRREWLHRTGRGCGFLTRRPSKRAATVLARLGLEVA